MGNAFFAFKKLNKIDEILNEKQKNRNQINANIWDWWNWHVKIACMSRKVSDFKLEVVFESH